MKAKTVLLSLLLPFVVPGLEFGEIYSDHMVLQSGMPIRICGTAAGVFNRSLKFGLGQMKRETGNWSFPLFLPADHTHSRCGGERRA